MASGRVEHSGGSRPLADLVLRQPPVAAVTGDHALDAETVRVGRATLLQADVCPFWRLQGTVCCWSFSASGGFLCSRADGSLLFSLASPQSRHSDRCSPVTPSPSRKGPCDDREPTAIIQENVFVSRPRISPLSKVASHMVR